MASLKREAGDTARERPGIVYPLLPIATRPNTLVMIEAAALDRQTKPPTVLEIAETSNNERKSSCWKLARQSWEPPLRPKFRSNEGKCRCRKPTSRPWEPLIPLKPSHNEGKCRCLGLRFQPLPPQRPLLRQLQPPLYQASTLQCSTVDCLTVYRHSSRR